MKWLRSNGRRLEVRDCGPVIFRLRAEGRAPLPLADEVVEDAEARRRLRVLLDSGFYAGGAVA